MTDSRAGVVAVVVAYRSAPFLAACVEGLVAAQVDGVVVVDNNDDDQDAPAVTRLLDSFPGVLHTLTTGRNLGFGAACNLGAALAVELGADVLWFVNPDTVAAPGAARRLAAGMRSHGFALASPLLTTGPPAQETVWFGGGTFDVRRGRARHDLLGAAVAAAPAEPRECTFLTGAALAVTREAWEKLGGFDTRYFLYWEDSDLSWRATQAGLRLGVVPSAVVWHAEGASSAQATDPGRSAVGYYFYTRNRFVLARRVGRLRGWFAGAGLLTTLKPIGAALIKERAGRKTAAALRGTLDGLFGHHSKSAPAMDPSRARRAHGAHD